MNPNSEATVLGRGADPNYTGPAEPETAAERAEAELPTQFEFAEWQLTVKGNSAAMVKLVERLETTQVGRQLEQGRRLLAAARDET